MINGASMKMHEVNPLIEVRNRVQGGNNLEEANEAFNDNKDV
jgi:hypothetical protein